MAEESLRISRVLNTDWRVDQILATSLPTTTPRNSYVSVQLKVKYDSRPQDGAILPSISVDNQRIKESSFEMTSDKLDVMIYELSNAIQLLDTVNG